MEMSSRSSVRSSLIIFILSLLILKTISLSPSPTTNDLGNRAHHNHHLKNPHEFPSETSYETGYSYLRTSASHNHKNLGNLKKSRRSLPDEFLEVGPMCRHKRYYPPKIFEWDTCAYCYKYMRNGPTNFGTPSRKLQANFMPFLDTGTNTNATYWILALEHNSSFILANVSDPESPIWASFANEGSKRDWTDCCLAARDCCQRMITSANAKLANGEDSEPSVSEGLCPATWDGWQCWDETEAGVTAKSFCPPYIYSLTEPPSCSIPLEKSCTEKGSWYRRRVNVNISEEWTNYGGCGSATVTLQLRRAYVLVASYAVSIVAIVPALIIFFAYKQLRVHRIILHQNLFISILMNGVLVIIFKMAIIVNEIQHSENSLVQQNGVGCRFLLILTKYSRMTNYMWMFCEGFYLHKLIAAAFAEQKSLLVFYLIGWVFPILPTATYAIYRLTSADTKCWVVPEEAWEWVLNGPSLLSLVLNTLFLINIIRVLVTKLRSTHTQEPSQYRKAVRATLVLLPLFGLHFIVTIYRPSSSTGVCLWTEIYFYANDILDGIQGFLVALIFCYFNGEVATLLKRTYTRFKEDYFARGLWPRRQSTAKNRTNRQGSLGRSVMSTHVYSSVPPSPETNCLTVTMSSGGSPTAGAAANLLAVNGNSRPNNVSNSESQTSLKLRPPVNGKPVNLYVTSERGTVTRQNPEIDSSSV